MLPAPVLEPRDGLTVVRDDLLPGGTKRRVLADVLPPAAEYVYASPAYGYAQVALAYVCRDLGAQATVFTAKRALLHPRTREAQQVGAKIVLVPTGYLRNVQAKARAYADAAGACYLPFGFDTPEMTTALATVARALPVDPPEVWTVAGSGTLSRALQAAWPRARCHAVQVGRVPVVGRAALYVAPEPFERDAQRPPPFPSCSNYDAKAWRFVTEHARPGALFWNVAA
jgi:hypothetical protein